jgi:hypothetical protein
MYVFYFHGIFRMASSSGSFLIGFNSEATYRFHIEVMLFFHML